MTIKSKMTRKSLSQLEELTGGKLTLGKLIWAIRESEGISQVKFSKTLNITKQHLCDIEHDRKNISPKLAASYAETLGYSREQFVRLALQDMLDRDDLKLVVDIIPIKNRGHDQLYHAA